MGSQTIVFAGDRRLACGPLTETALVAKAAVEAGETASVVIFDTLTSERIEVDADLPDLRPGAEDKSGRGRGRPKLGVVAREVTLLPRHWDWLADQDGGASAALRRLVEEARRTSGPVDRLRRGRDALYRFATVMAGDAVGYEEAIRALYADKRGDFEARTAGWPRDVRAHALTLAEAAFTREATLLSAVAAPRHNAAQRAIASAFPGKNMESMEILAPGASGAQVFRLVVGGEAFVLRVDGPADVHRDPARQYACMKIAAAAGVAPVLIYADAVDAVSITRMVTPNAERPPLARDEWLAALVDGLRRLHAAPLFPARGEYLDSMATIVSGFAQSGLMNSGGLAPLLSLWANLLRAYPRGCDPVSSHNDFNPSNVIFEGATPWIIDWEASGATDRFVDIAALANWFTADEAEVEQVLNLYFDGPPNPGQRARFVLMRQINRLFYGIMLVNAAAAEHSDVRLTLADITDAPRLAAIRSEMPTIATFRGRLRFGLVFLSEALRGRRTAEFGAALTAR